MKTYVVAAAMLSCLLRMEDNLLYTHQRNWLSSPPRLQAQRRTLKKAKLGNFPKKVVDRQFKRYFRMSRECFDHLCDRIEQNAGQLTFKSEQYLYGLCPGTIEENKQNKMNSAHVKSAGGFISGEVKLALTLRLLTGCTYMDLVLLYEVGMTYTYEILHDVVSNWINDDRLVNITETIT